MFQGFYCILDVLHTNDVFKIWNHLKTLKTQTSETVRCPQNVYSPIPTKKTIVCFAQWAQNLGRSSEVFAMLLGWPMSVPLIYQRYLISMRLPKNVLKIQDISGTSLILPLNVLKASEDVWASSGRLGTQILGFHCPEKV